MREQSLHRVRLTVDYTHPKPHIAKLNIITEFYHLTSRVHMVSNYKGIEINVTGFRVISWKKQTAQ
jgi:hypothetical protein